MRFTLFQIPVVVRPAFFLISAMLALSRLNVPLNLLLWLAVVFVSVMLHELGHALAFHMFGIRSSIELHGMGGATMPLDGRTLAPEADFAVALAGPSMGFAVGGLLWWLTQGVPIESPVANQVLHDLLWTNLGWGAVNLVPIWPLDGGHAWRAVLRKLVPQHSDLVLLVSSTLFAVVGAVWAASVGWSWAALLAGWFGADSAGKLWSRFRRRPDRLLESTVVEGYRHLSSGRLHEAKASAQQALAGAKTDQLRASAVHLLACAELASGDPAAALVALEQAPSTQPVDPTLEGLVLLKIPGRARDAIAPLSQAFERTLQSGIGAALIEALLLAGELDVAQGLLESASGPKLDDETHAKVERALYSAHRPGDAVAVSKLRDSRRA